MPILFYLFCGSCPNGPNDRWVGIIWERGGGVFLYLNMVGRFGGDDPQFFEIFDPIESLFYASTLIYPRLSAEKIILSPSHLFPEIHRQQQQKDTCVDLFFGSFTNFKGIQGFYTNFQAISRVQGAKINSRLFKVFNELCKE